MKIQRNNLTRLSRAIRAGATVGVAIFAASALHAQAPNQTPSPDQTTPLPGQNAPPAAAEPSGTISHRAKVFLEDAAKADQTEIAMANIADGRSQNSGVKSLAEMMRKDHEQNYAQLQSLAQAHGVSLDTSPGWINDMSVKRLKRANDAEFDKQFTKDMIKDHVEAIKTFDKAVADIEEPDIRQFAQGTLPTLRHHLRHSEETAQSVGVDQDTISRFMKDLPAEEPDRGVSFNQ
jgi:putative membrane protein